VTASALRGVVQIARRDAGKLPAINFGSWPGLGFPGDRRKLTLAGRALAPKVIVLAQRRTHTGGQEPKFTSDR
jgi:hypothetical protein